MTGTWTPYFPRLLAVLALAAGMAFGGHGSARAGDAPVVVELFTSQGCSSCPPADVLLGELAGRSDVVALTLPVDYWDYLGWQDTLAMEAFTNRQHAYARWFGESRVYTPQMVFNGRTHAIGSKRGEVEAAIEEQHRLSAVQSVQVTIDTSDAAITVTAAGFEGETAEATVWLLLTSKSVDVQIGRGENRGRILTYFNVVRMMMPIGQWHGDAVELSLPKTDLMEGYDGCAALLQVDGSGPILGAAFLSDAMMASY